jgi:hypothetical protein
MIEKIDTGRSLRVIADREGELRVELALMTEHVDVYPIESWFHQHEIDGKRKYFYDFWGSAYNKLKESESRGALNA